MMFGLGQMNNVRRFDFVSPILLLPSIIYLLALLAGYFGGWHDSQVGGFLIRIKWTF